MNDFIERRSLIAASTAALLTVFLSSQPAWAQGTKSGDCTVSVSSSCGGRSGGGGIDPSLPGRLLKGFFDGMENSRRERESQENIPQGPSQDDLDIKRAANAKTQSDCMAIVHAGTRTNCLEWLKLVAKQKAEAEAEARRQEAERKKNLAATPEANAKFALEGMEYPDAPKKRAPVPNIAHISEKPESKTNSCSSINPIIKKPCILVWPTVSEVPKSKASGATMNYYRVFENSCDYPGRVSATAVGSTVNPRGTGILAHSKSTVSCGTYPGSPSSCTGLTNPTFSMACP